MVPMTASTTSPHRAAWYRIARLGLDVAAALAIGAAAGVVALVAFHDTSADFVGGPNGRVVFTALCAVAAAYGADGLFDSFFGGLRDWLVEARLELLVEDAKETRERHAKALAQIDTSDPRTALYLTVLRDAAAKAEARALKAGALPAELS